MPTNAQALHFVAQKKIQRILHLLRKEIYAAPPGLQRQLRHLAQFCLQPRRPRRNLRRARSR